MDSKKFRAAARSGRTRVITGTLGVVTTIALGGALLLAAANGGTAAVGPHSPASDRVVDAGTGSGGSDAEYLAASATVHRFPAMADLNGRAGPQLNAKTLRVNASRAGQLVPVVCQTKGGNAYGSTIWDRTSDGYYVADHYVKTGYDGFAAAVPRCSAGTSGVRSFPAKADLDGRSAPYLTAKTLKVNAYRSGTSVPVVCQTKGGNAYGSTIWDRTSDGYYVADHYVKTGADGFVSGLPRCTGVPGEPSGPVTPPAGGGTVKGIDISSNQASMNVAGQAKAGMRFVFVKATEGSSYVNPAYGRQTADAARAGMLHGAYHFANPAGASGATQANYFIAHGGGWTADGKTLPGVLDIEFNPYKDGKGTCYGVSTTAMNTWIADFLNTYRKRTGRDAIIYTATTWWKTCTGNTSRFAGNPLWIANYTGTAYPMPNGWSKPLIWQYTSKPFDHNTFYGSMNDLRTFAKGSKSSPTKPPTTEPPVTPPSNGTKTFKASVAVDGRSAKRVDAKRIKEYKAGTALHIKCQAYGAYAYGSPIWDKTTDNLWVPDFYVKTGVTGFVKGMAKCDNDPKPKEPSTAGCINTLNSVSCGQAVAWARAHVGRVSSDYDHRCDHVTGLAYGHGASGSASAKSHWYAIPSQYRHPGDRSVPAGGLAFFDNHTYGHVMISIGNGKFVSNDIHGHGKLSITTIPEIERSWGMHYAGWGQPWFQINH
jgi:GH25 family lysozyme M1 (1,4-beta-N-acetylmuramidase)